MKRLAPASLLLVLAAASSTTGCASSCSANAHKLAALKRGMSYEDATQVMGCPGTQVGTPVTQTSDVSTVEWNGPGPGVVSRTQLDFRDGHLLSFTTGNRGGW
jgi:hypothetical protein